MHWHTAPVDDDGTQFAYLDSGAPPTSDYTTFVFVHGYTFTASVFRRLFPVAPAHNARIIAFNRRDYADSTPFSEADLSLITGNDESAHRKFLRVRGLEVARFLYWVVTELKIPRTNLALLGWSLGNIFTIAFVAHLNEYPADIVQTLEPYLTSFFIYAPPYMFTGYPNPPGSFNPFYFPDNPQRIAPPWLGTWVSHYYKHPAYLESRPVSTLTPAAFVQYSPEQPYRPCTIDTMSADELAEIIDVQPSFQSERFYYDFTPFTLHKMLEDALLRTDECQLPSLKVHYVWGLEDLWCMGWAACEFEKDLAKWKANGVQVRPTTLVPVQKANHFIHWDNANDFLKLLVKYTRS